MQKRESGKQGGSSGGATPAKRGRPFGSTTGSAAAAAAAAAVSANESTASPSILGPSLQLHSTFSVLSSLKRRYDEALRTDDVKAIVVTARKPSVAAIDGLALDGGLEVMACHAWISTSGPQLGVFDLLFGILPVFGGTTQGPPELVGLSNSKGLEMMLTSRQVIGEVDRSLAVFYATFYNRIHYLAKSKREKGIVYGPGAELWKQVDTFERLLHHSDTWKNLVHIFFAQRGLTRNQAKSRL